MMVDSSEDLNARRGGRLRRNVNIIEEEIDTRSRPVRATRRAQEETKVNVGRTRSRGRINEDSNESGSVQQQDDTYEMSDINDGPKTRGRSQRNNVSKSRGRRQQEQLPSSDDDSVDSRFYSDEDGTDDVKYKKRLRSGNNASRSNAR